MKKEFDISEVFERAAYERGLHAEDFFAELIQSYLDAGKMPSWFYSMHRTERNSKADFSGVDFIVHTDRGRVKVNVKSSRAFVQIFCNKHPGTDIVVVVVDPMKKRGPQLGAIISAIGGAYKKL